MKLRNPKATIVPRTLQFLEDVYTQSIVKKDKEPRMVFTAMKYCLTPSPVIYAAVTLGCIRRYGMEWDWVATKPTPKMAEEVREGAARWSRERSPLSPNARMRNKYLRGER